jgi:hypothetical protein
MFGAVVSKITLTASALRAPPFGIFCEFASAMTSKQKEDTDAQETPNENDELAFKERPANPLMR